MTYYHQQYIPNKTSNNFDIWYTGLNLCSVEKFFSFLFILIFSRPVGAERSKIDPNLSKMQEKLRQQ